MKLFNDVNKLEEFHIINDDKTGLTAIISIHSTRLGPALGGCRCVSYQGLENAIEDSLLLSRAMSYKAAMSGLEQGGGKAVINKPAEIKNRHDYFLRFGEFVESLKGRYITAVDSGTTFDDLNIIAKKTNYIAGLPQANSDNESDPSFMTAMGVRRGIEAAIQFSMGRDSLEGIHVAIQGVGKVGLFLAEDLAARGAKLTICDVNATRLANLPPHLKATIVNNDDIYKVKCDVFAPCALGGIINETTINQLQTKIICGAANNQLADDSIGEILLKRKIIYAPDYVINAGGLICASHQYNKKSKDECHEKTLAIYDTLLTLFERSKTENLPTNFMANKIAEERINR